MIEYAMYLADNNRKHEAYRITEKTAVLAQEKRDYYGDFEHDEFDKYVKLLEKARKEVRQHILK